MFNISLKPPNSDRIVNTIVSKQLTLQLIQVRTDSSRNISSSVRWIASINERISLIATGSVRRFMCSVIEVVVCEKRSSHSYANVGTERNSSCCKKHVLCICLSLLYTCALSSMWTLIMISNGITMMTLGALLELQKILPFNIHF